MALPLVSNNGGALTPIRAHTNQSMSNSADSAGTASTTEIHLLERRWRGFDQQTPSLELGDLEAPPITPDGNWDEGLTADCRECRKRGAKWFGTRLQTSRTEGRSVGREI